MGAIILGGIISTSVSFQDEAKFLSTSGTITPASNVSVINNLTGGSNQFIYNTNIYNSLTQLISLYTNYSLYSTQVVDTINDDRDVWFGVISNDTALEVTLYNRGVQTLTYNDTIFPSTTGLYVEDITDGTTIPPLGSVTFNIVARLLEGDARVSEYIAIDFTTAIIRLSVKIVRQPNIVYSFIPDRGTYSEAYKTNTSIFRATSGLERRYPKNYKNKLSFKYSATTTTIEDAMMVHNHIYQGLYKEMFQPNWAFLSLATAPSVQSYFVQCDTYRNIFFTGDTIAIIYEDVSLLLTIVNVGVESLEIQDPVTIPAGAYILPATKAVPNSSTSSNYQTSVGKKFSVTLEQL